MFCSTVIPTIGRASLSRAVNSVLEQDFREDDFEVIVVNDSGLPLLESEWQSSPRVVLVNTQRRERSVARNVGAAIAKGKYLHFLDDDDWLLPGALKAFWDLAQVSDADWLYGISQLIDRSGNQLIQLHHQMKGNCFVQVMAGEWIPLQSSLIDISAFFSVGGFNPLIVGPEDIDLSRRIALYNEFEGTPVVVACIGMGEEGSTTDRYSSVRFHRWARESILELPGVFDRMFRSAHSSYWYGRVVRAYLTSAVWNLQNRKTWIATSRLAYGLLSLTLSLPHFTSLEFWRAVWKRYSSETFLRELSVDVESA